MKKMERDITKVKFLTDKLYLKIKIKSLAEEARIIKKEEKSGKHLLRHKTGLWQHRISVVRREARVSMLAYACIRNKPYSVVEKAPKKQDEYLFCFFYSDKFWEDVQRLARKYGAVFNYGRPLDQERLRLKEYELYVEKWIKDAKDYIAQTAK